MSDKYENIIICPYYDKCHEEDVVYFDNYPQYLSKYLTSGCIQCRKDGRDKINKTSRRTKKYICNLMIDRELYPSWKEIRDTLLAERKESLKKYYLIDYIRVLNIIEQKMKEEN